MRGNRLVPDPAVTAATGVKFPVVQSGPAFITSYDATVATCGNALHGNRELRSSCAMRAGARSPVCSRSLAADQSE